MPELISDSSDDSSDEEDRRNNQQTHESPFSSRVSRSVDANAVNDQNKMESLKVNDHENFANLSSSVAAPVDVFKAANAVTATAFVKSVAPLSGTAADSFIVQKMRKSNK